MLLVILKQIMALKVWYMFSILVFTDTVSGLREGWSHVCKHHRYSRDKYYTSCGFGNWGRCTRYRTKTVYYLQCCPGYSNGGFQPDCRYPICDGKIRSSACSVYYSNDVIAYRPGSKSPQRYSGGYCQSPNVCAGCNDGFYADGPYCRICPKISHCLHRRCTNVYDNHCEYCDGEIIDKRYWRAYIRRRENSYKTCEQACSWRTDSRRCYPGTCADETVGSCKCLDGFGGRHCETIVTDSTIAYVVATLKSKKPTDDPVEQPRNPNDPIPRDTRWTNQNLIEKASLKVEAVFKSNDTCPRPDITGRYHFVTEFKYGIGRGEMRLTLFRATNSTIRPIVRPCRVKKALPTNDIYQCKEPDVVFQQWSAFLPFKHDDKVIFSFEITNGGYIKYIDRDAHPNNPETAPRIKVDLNGRTVTRNFTFHWDLIEPLQRCVRDHGLKCTKPPVFTPDVITNPSIPLHWDGWIDDLAGIGSYAYEVFKLGNDGSALSEDQGTKVADGHNIPSTDVSLVFNVSSPGMYSVILYAIDQAGNEKSARTLFFYDDSSHVELVKDKIIQVKESTKATGCLWIVVDNPFLNVKWPGKFQNKKHYTELWLESVKPRKHIDVEYDDHYGKRKTTAEKHVQGIVRFETQFVVLSHGTPQPATFVSTNDVLSESTSLSVNWNDGDQLDITVRAYDIFDMHAEDVVTVYRDTSPPEVENFWLSKADRMNISIHSTEDLSQMAIEWDAFDYHSGISNLQWRLFDNHTNILHDYDVMHSQGESSNLTECQEKYRDAPRCPSCYCTTFHGCFKKHFYVKPNMNTLGAFSINGKGQGVGNTEYYMEVTVVNKALLKTVVVTRVEIDIP